MTGIRQKIDHDVLDDARLPDLCFEALRGLCPLHEKLLRNNALPNTQVLNCAREWKTRTIHASADAKAQRPDVLDRPSDRHAADALVIDEQLVLAAGIAREGNTLSGPGADQGRGAVYRDPPGRCMHGTHQLAVRLDE